MRRSCIVEMPGLVLRYAMLVMFAVAPVHSVLRADFYADTCPDLMDLMKEAMVITQENDPVNMPAVLRLFAHDAMVNGADGGILLSTGTRGRPEREAPPNLTLFGFEAIDFLKSVAEENCPGVVSCADILAISAQFAVELTGGPVYQTLLGRKDSRISKYNDAVAQLPTETMNMTQLVAKFATMGLTQRDLVVLSGSHTIGFAHCESFVDRLYYFNKTSPVDPSLDFTLADDLKHVCPKDYDVNTVQGMDISSIEVFDNGYFFNLQLKEGLLASDQLLWDHPSTKHLVDTFAQDQNAFFAAFAQSMINLGNSRVLTGSAGEIRAVCDSRKNS